MVVRLIVNDNDTSNNSYHQIGRVTGLQCNLDIAEIVAFNSKVSNADAAFVEGYMAVKWGLTSALPSGHNYKSYTSWPDMLITTGQASKPSNSSGPQPHQLVSKWFSQRS